MDDLTVGVSAAGMSSYLTTLEELFITGTNELIDDISELTTTIDAGWQGQAKDYFYAKFQELREAVKDDLKNEHIDLTNRLLELQSELFEIDANLAADIE